MTLVADRTVERLHGLLPRIYSREFVEAIFVNPYCRPGGSDRSSIRHCWRFSRVRG